MEYNQYDFEIWLDDVDYEFYVLLGESVDDYSVDYVSLYLEGYEPEAVVRKVYDEES